MIDLGSDIIHAEVLGTDLIILNSAKAARELLERRSSLYSDRYSDTQPSHNMLRILQTCT